MTETVNITALINDISTRSGRAILAQLNLRSPMLRNYLARLYAQAPGEPGSLLADPVVEATFGWRAADADMRTLAREGVLSQKLVDAMARPASEYRSEYAFPLERQPFRHQLV